MEESIRTAEDRDKWRKYVDAVANRRIDDGKRTEQNSVVFVHCCPFSEIKRRIGQNSRFS